VKRGERINFFRVEGYDLEVLYGGTTVSLGVFPDDGRSPALVSVLLKSDEIRRLIRALRWGDQHRRRVGVVTRMRRP
jgi:hypothetical protein